MILFNSRRLLWRLFPSYLAITVVSVVAVIWLGSSAIRAFYLDQMTREVQSRARLAEQLVRLSLSLGTDRLRAVVGEAGLASQTRITVIWPDGRVAADSQVDPALLGNHKDRKEVAAALEGGEGSAIRYSYSVKERMMYVALPVMGQKRVAAVVRVALPLDKINEALMAIYIKVALGGGVIVLLAAVFSLWTSRRISRPLEEIRHGAERVAQGDFNARLAVPDTEEFGALAMALNQMAAQMHERIQTVLAQKNELEAVLSSMSEAVLAVDNRGRLINMNQAASRLLGVDFGRARGRMVLESTGHPALHQFIHQVLAAGHPIEKEILLQTRGEMVLKAGGSPLLNGAGETMGGLVVLNDVTRLRRLETVQKEFVANVSHELRTPIAAIKGGAETLLEEQENLTPSGEKFLNIIARQADRLAHIIEDLLMLSRIEEDEDSGAITLETGAVEPVILAAVADCEHSALTRKVAVEPVWPQGVLLTARINPPLLEQALVNLIDNAIKYSPEGGTVRIRSALVEGQKKTGGAEQEANPETLGLWVEIRVEDQGPGIEKRHLDRLFQRFYRAEKSRSRHQGGTGLGLSIVKHIAQLHGGVAGVESTPGQGSVFTLRLPHGKPAG